MPAHLIACEVLDVWSKRCKLCPKNKWSIYPLSDLLAASNGDNDDAACKYLLGLWKICSNARSDVQRACNSGIRQGRHFQRISRQLMGEAMREDGSGSMFSVTEGSDDDLIIVDHDEDEGYGDSGSDDDSSIY